LHFAIKSGVSDSVISLYHSLKYLLTVLISNPVFCEVKGAEIEFSKYGLNALSISNCLFSEGLPFSWLKLFLLYTSLCESVT